MVITFEGTKEDSVKTLSVPEITTIIQNPRSNITGIAIQYGYNNYGRNVYIRWSSLPEQPYCAWEEVDLTVELKEAYNGCRDFSE